MVSAQKISGAAAASHLQGFDLVDPDGVATVESVVAAGICFLVTLAGVPLVYVLQRVGDAIWITAAAGNTRAATVLVLSHIEQQATAMGAHLVKFQTVRAGLAKLAERAGYARTGHVFTKALA